MCRAFVAKGLARNWVSIDWALGRASGLLVGGLLCAGVWGLGAGCTGTDFGIEAPEACLDSKDNDGDGLVDCDDPDCRRLAICGSPVRADLSLIPLDGPPPQRDGPTPTDTLPPKRDFSPPPPSSYGQRCTKRGKLCPDGDTICVGSLYSSSLGFCSRPCFSSSSCLPTPSGTTAKCDVYTYNGTNYCTFACEWQNAPFSCPSGLRCYPWTSSQAMCFP